MVCCGSVEASKEFPRDDTPSMEGNGGKKDRTCTDQTCALLFLVCVAGAAGLVALSVVKGDARRLTRGLDYGGNLCGVDEAVAGKPFLYYCGSHERVNGFPKRLDYRSKTCVASCPQDDSENIECLTKAFHNFTKLGEDAQHSFWTTLNVDIVQSVTLQKSYPTEEYHASFCVPQHDDQSSLREDTLDHMKRSMHVAGMVSSFRHAWPLPVAAALLALLLSLVFLHVLRSFAGPLLFATLCAGTLLMLLLGAFFAAGLFFDPWNPDGGYQRLNPLFQTYPGGEGKGASICTGLLLLLGGVCMGFATYHSVDKIDESIGVIQAACECIFSTGDGGAGWDLMLQPVWQSIALIVLVVGAFYGSMLVASVGYIEKESISVNDQRIEGLERDFRHYMGWRFVQWFYGASVVWIVLTTMAACQFALSYAVCLWYFVEIHEEPIEHQNPALDKALGNSSEMKEGLRLYGDDKVAGRHTGHVVKLDGGTEAVVIPIGQKGPHGKLVQLPVSREVKHAEFGGVERGFFEGVTHHLGSLALGSLVSAVTSPFRMVSQLIKAFASTDGEKGVPDVVDQSPAGLALAGASVFASLLDSLFGGFSKGAYVDLVLSSSNYWKCSKDAVDFILEVGGVVAFLHGSTGLFELVGVVVITLICGGAVFLTIDLDYFKDPHSAGYISDPWEITMISSLVAGIVSFSFMSLFNVVADTLLYTFAWSRHHNLKDIHLFCPRALRQMVHEELESTPSKLLQPSKGNSVTKHTNALRSMMSTMRGHAGGTSIESSPLLSA